MLSSDRLFRFSGLQTIESSEHEYGLVDNDPVDPVEGILTSEQEELFTQRVAKLDPQQIEFNGKLYDAYHVQSAEPDLNIPALWAFETDQELLEFADGAVYDSTGTPVGTGKLVESRKKMV